MGPPCLLQSGPCGCWVRETSMYIQVLVGAGLAGDLPVYYSQVLVGAGLERLPCTFRSLWVLG